MEFKKRALISGSFIYAFYVLGVLFPEKFWASHHLSFLGPYWQVLFLILAGFGLWSTHWESASNLLVPQKETSTIWTKWLLILPLLAGAFATAFPIFEDAYGDAYFIRPELDLKGEAWTMEMTKQLIFLNPFDPKNGVKLLYGVTTALGILFDTTFLSTLRWLEVFLLGVFSLTWGSIVMNSVRGSVARVMLGFAGAFAPVTLIYHSHTETYALSFTMAMVLIWVIQRYFVNRSLKWFFLVLLAWVISLKFHVLFWLVFPAVLLVIADHLSFKWSILERVFTWRGIFALVVLGTVAIVAIYLGYGAFNGTRFATAEDFYSAFFVPVNPKEGAPYNRYSLFGPAHLLDFLQVMFMWSPIAWFILFSASLRKLRGSEGNRFLQTITLVFAAFVLSMFVINPILGMPTDWDLFCFPSMFLLTIAVVVYGKMEQDVDMRPAMLLVVTLVIFELPTFVVNASESPLSKRYETVGRNEFRNFWAGSSTLFEAAYVLEPNRELKWIRMQQVLHDLEPASVKGNDLEYAELLRQAANYFMENGDLKTALTYHQQSLAYHPNLVRNHFEMANVQYRLGLYQDAFSHVPRFVQYEYPSRENALKAAVHLSIAVQQFESALRYTDMYLMDQPNDEFMLRVKYYIAKGEYEEVRKMFK